MKVAVIQIAAVDHFENGAQMSFSQILIDVRAILRELPKNREEDLEEERVFDNVFAVVECCAKDETYDFFGVMRRYAVLCDYMAS